MAASNTDPITGEPAGYGADTTPLTFVTGNTSAPSQPLPVTQTGSTGGSISLAWTAPSDSGGVPLQSYNVVINGAVKATVDASLATATTVYGLTNSAGGFQGSVAAVNVAGLVSQLSPAVSVATSAPTPPTEPRDVDITTTGGGLYASWTAPIDLGGMTLNSYRVYIRSEDDTDFTRVYQGLATSAQVGGLQPSTSYDMCVQRCRDVEA